MKTFLAILGAVLSLNAARIFEWSPFFMLQAPGLAVHKEPHTSQARQDLSIRVVPRSQKLAVSFYLTGIEPQSAYSLNIYNLNGKAVASLSNSFRISNSHIDWSVPDNASGIFCAQLRSKNAVKTIQFAIYK